MTALIVQQDHYDTDPLPQEPFNDKSRVLYVTNLPYDASKEEGGSLIFFLMIISSEYRISIGGRYSLKSPQCQK